MQVHSPILIRKITSTLTKPLSDSSVLQRKCVCGGTPGPTGECAACRRKRLGIQPKLTINQPGDRYEREADRVAEQVMRMPEPQLQRLLEDKTGDDRLVRPSQLCKQEDPYSCRDRGCSQFGRVCEPIEPGTMRGCKCAPTMLPASSPPQVEEETLQTKAVSGHTSTVTPTATAQISAMRGGGQPLPQPVRDFMEPRFGYDFSQVRIHTDARAAESAEAVNARAYTVANDIAFRCGEYSPETLSGRRLLAHELTHVIQQSHAFARPTLQRQAEPPRLPDFPGLATALSHNIGENLYAYGHHFYRIATLYPDQPDLLEDAFARYALGQNVLETGYSFLGAETATAEALALTTGITFKGVNFLTTGELVIDYQFDLGRDLKLETGIDLAVNPNDYTDVKRVDAGVSLVGHF